MKKNTETKTNESNIFDEIPELRRIKHDIHNLKRLTPTQMKTIKSLSNENKMYVIELYDKMMDWFTHFAEEM